METVQRYFGPAKSGGEATTPDPGVAPKSMRSDDNAPISARAQNALRSEFSSDADMSEILAQFVSGLPEQVAQITHLVEHRNLDELRRSLHRIKGAGGGYGFPRMTDMAEHAEKQINAGAALEAVVGDIIALLDLIRSVEGYDAEMEVAHVAKSSDH